MSSTLPLLDPQPVTANVTPADVSQAGVSEVGPPTLSSLRAELDRVDDAIHDMLMQRAKIVVRVGNLAAKGQVALRPGREADIIRRLLRRHTGMLPRRALPRIWRELFAATTAMQGPYAVTVCELQSGASHASSPGAYLAIAREHFGAATTMRPHRSPAQAIAEVSVGTAIAAVLPMPAEDEATGVAWWTALLQRDEPRIHVVGRLPFWSPRAEGAPQARALVVSAAMPDKSEADRSLLGLELPLEMSRARANTMLVEACLQPLAIILRRDPHDPMALALVEVDGYVSDDDSRLARLALRRPPVVLGAYAVPVDGETQ